MERPLGVVLAGGAGRRMGRAKGTLLVKGRTMADRAAAVLDPLCDGVVVSLAPGGDNPAPGRPSVADTPPAGRGPLAGIARVFELHPARDLLVLACDYVDVESDDLAPLLEGEPDGPAVVMLRDASGQDHPLVALWRAGARAPVLDALRASSFAVRAVVEAAGVRRVDTRRTLVNANRPGDLRS